jgi:hypothetical protein
MLTRLAPTSSTRIAPVPRTARRVGSGRVKILTRDFNSDGDLADSGCPASVASTGSHL